MFKSFFIPPLSDSTYHWYFFSYLGRFDFVFKLIRFLKEKLFNPFEQNNKKKKKKNKKEHEIF